MHLERPTICIKTKQDIFEPWNFDFYNGKRKSSAEILKCQNTELAHILILIEVSGTARSSNILQHKTLYQGVKRKQNGRFVRHEEELGKF